MMLHAEDGRTAWPEAPHSGSALGVCGGQRVPPAKIRGSAVQKDDVVFSKPSSSGEYPATEADEGMAQPASDPSMGISQMEPVS